MSKREAPTESHDTFLYLFAVPVYDPLLFIAISCPLNSGLLEVSCTISRSYMSYKYEQNQSRNRLEYFRVKAQF